MGMRWLPVAARTCACANSRTCYLFLNMGAEHNTVLFGLKLGWGFRHLWNCSNNNKGDWSYHVLADVLQSRRYSWTDLFISASKPPKQTKIGACALSARFFYISIHGCTCEHEKNPHFVHGPLTPTNTIRMLGYATTSLLKNLSTNQLFCVHSYYNNSKQYW